MAHADAFALPHSDLNGFLFADVGVEASGNMLSVLSALARMGLDPWQEGGRLARLPRPAAVDALAGLIAKMPASLWPLPAATAIAGRLVALLPQSRGPFEAAPHGAAGPAALRGRLQLAVVFVVLATAFAGLASSLTNQQAAALISGNAASSATHPGASPPASGK